MNRLDRTPVSRWPPIALRPLADFADTPPPPAWAGAADPDAVVEILVGRHCAGMAGRAGGTEVRAALLRGEPERTTAANRTISWFLRGCAPADALRLIARGQVPVPALVAFMHALDVHNPRVVRMLNQFAPPGDDAALQRTE